MEDEKQIQELLNRALARTATEDELYRLAQLVQNDREGDIVTYIEALLQNKEGGEAALGPAALSPGKASAIVDAVLNSDKVSAKRPSAVLNLTKRMAVAASVIVLIGLSIVLLVKYRSEKAGSAYEVIATPKNEALPGSNKAMLRLGNGQMIVLDSASKGMIAVQGNTKILKTGDGTLLYNPEKRSADETLYNSIITPRGGQFQVTLPDQSKVWLNAATTIRFPTRFAGDQRMIELSGEAYFEVQADVSRPFRVKVNNTVVEVLGTHFNIMAYSDEPEMNTTLLEGKVKVTGARDSVLLAPGQQAIVKGDNLQLLKDVNTDKAIAWKNGYFQFSKIDASVMRQISRWYDVDLVYEDSIREKEYSARIRRDVKLSDLVAALAVIPIHCQIQGKKLVLKR